MKNKEKEEHLQGCLRQVTTRQLLAELDIRMQEWPTEMRAARAFIRGTIQATEDHARQTKSIKQALDRTGS